MFDSGVKVKDLIEDVKSEADIALDIPDKTYLEWFNSLQRLLYTEIIRKQAEKVIASASENVNLTSLDGITGDTIRFEDIYAVYKGNTQLIKTTVTSGAVFPECYYKDENGNMIFKSEDDGNLKIIYFVKPALVALTEQTVNNETVEVIPDNVNVMLPYEFLDLVKAKLRGEAYKLANEDILSAKWLNDYNILLENFKKWTADKAPRFGM